MSWVAPVSEGIFAKLYFLWDPNKTGIKSCGQN